MPYLRGGVVFLSAVHTLERLLADNISAPLQAIAELSDKLAGGEVGEDFRATFELRELVDELPGFENVFAGGELLSQTSQCDGLHWTESLDIHREHWRPIRRRRLQRGSSQS